MSKILVNSAGKIFTDNSGKVMVEEGAGPTPTGETWVIGRYSVRYADEVSTEINFISNNNSYTNFKCYINPLIDENELYYNSTRVCNGDSNTWLNQAYRTVTFETAPTGELLTWLQKNAVKQ